MTVKNTTEIKMKNREQIKELNKNTRLRGLTVLRPTSTGKTSELTLLIDSLKKITRTQVRITKLKNKLSLSQVSH